MLFNFLNFFALLFEILYSGSSSKGRNEKFFFLSFSTCPDPFSLEMKPEWCFLIFLIFLPFFLEFSILGRAGRIGTIIVFSLFLDLSRPVLAWNEAWIAHFNFLYLFAFFLEFSILGRVGQIGTIIFFFSHSWPVPTRFGLNWSLNGGFKFFEFFCYFFWSFLFWVGSGGLER